MKLAQRGGGIRERERRAPDEAVRVGAVGLDQGVVEGPRQPGAELGRRPVGHGGRERQGVDLHALSVRPRTRRSRSQYVESSGTPTPAPPTLIRGPCGVWWSAGPVRPTLLLDEVEEALWEEVRVDVDAVGPGHAGILPHFT